VLQIGGDLDLGQEPLGADDGGKLRLEHFDGDLPVVLQVMCEVHRRHAARPQLSLDAVPIGERGGETVGNVAHRRAFIRAWSSTSQCSA
jgi:hypothetical protein